jgi:hypothetical protein
VIVPGNDALNLRRLAILETNLADLSVLFTLDHGEPTSPHPRREALAVYGYATLWFTTPFLALSTYVSRDNHRLPLPGQVPGAKNGSGDADDPARPTCGQGAGGSSGTRCEARSGGPS